MNDFQTDGTEEDGRLRPIPEGKYLVIIEEVNLTRSSAGNPTLQWTFRILEGPFQDRRFCRYNAITDKTRKYVISELRICGLEPSHFSGLELNDFSELRQNLDKLVGVTLEVAKKSRDVYFNHRIVTNDRGQRNRRDARSDVPSRW